MSDTWVVEGEQGVLWEGKADSDTSALYQAFHHLGGGPPEAMRRLGFTARKKPRMVAVGLEDVTSVIEIFERMAKELYGGYTSSSMERLKQQVGIE